MQGRDTVELVFDGIIIPDSWYKYIKFKSGKPDMNAIILLAEVVAVYTPIRERNRIAGEVIYRKKFEGDKWQVSYQKLADKFGLTKRQTIDALKRLRDAGLITIEFRTEVTDIGCMCPNVMYVEPVPEAIDAITRG